MKTMDSSVLCPLILSSYLLLWPAFSSKMSLAFYSFLVVLKHKSDWS